MERDEIEALLRNALTECDLDKLEKLLLRLKNEYQVSVDDIEKTYWFGEPWPRADYRAPVCEDDSYRLDVPVGEDCYLCEEPIAKGDRGMALPLTRGGYDGIPLDTKLGYQHLECGMRSVMGCSGNLMGEGHSHHLPYREDARRVMVYLNRQVGR